VVIDGGKLNGESVAIRWCGIGCDLESSVEFGERWTRVLELCWTVKQAGGALEGVEIT